MISRRHVALLLVAVAVASCRSSPPKHFYVLDPVPPQHGQSATTKAVVQLAAVNIPPSVDRQEMVRESAAESLEISDRNRWGAPLADMTQDVLTRDLMERLPRNQVIPPRTSAPSGAYVITVDLLQFGTDVTGNVVLEGGWSLYRLGADTPLLNRDVELSQKPASSDYSAEPRLMSQLLGRLADEIVSAIP